MVNNQRNYSILLTALIYCCCCILDLGVSFPRGYKPSTYHFKYNNGHNNNKRTTEMNNNIINAEERYFNLSECKPIMIKRMKQFSQDNDQCNKTNMINDLKGEVAHLWCHAGSLLLKKNKQYNFAKHHDHGRHQLDINQTYEFKPINQKIYSKMLQSNDLLSRLQSDYVNSTNSYKKEILGDVELLINLLKSHVLKKILFNAGCAEIDLCENIKKINYHGKKKKQHEPTTKTEIRINQRYYRILKTIYDHLSESLRLIFSHRNEEFDPELFRGQCSQPRNIM